MIPLADFERNFKKSNGCWIWEGWKGPHGYGSMKIPGERKAILAHRLSYLLYFGNLTKGRHVHHTCNNRLCVNPSHLQELSIISHAIMTNLSERTKTHCIRGHEFTLENTSISSQGSRRCLQCVKIYNDKRTRRVRRKRIKEKLGI